MTFSESSLIYDNPLFKYSKSLRNKKKNFKTINKKASKSSIKYRNTDSEMKVVSFKESHTGTETDQHYIPYQTYQSFKIEDFSVEYNKTLSYKEEGKGNTLLVEESILRNEKTFNVSLRNKAIKTKFRAKEIMLAPQVSIAGRGIESQNYGILYY